MYRKLSKEVFPVTTAEMSWDEIKALIASLAIQSQEAKRAGAGRERGAPASSSVEEKSTSRSISSLWMAIPL